jgi:hypothetical protein
VARSPPAPAAPAQGYSAGAACPGLCQPGAR